jgi:hypothetical protein
MAELNEGELAGLAPHVRDYIQRLRADAARLDWLELVLEPVHAAARSLGAAEAAGPEEEEDPEPWVYINLELPSGQVAVTAWEDFAEGDGPTLRAALDSAIRSDHVAGVSFAGTVLLAEHARSISLNGNGKHAPAAVAGDPPATAEPPATEEHPDGH